MIYLKPIDHRWDDKHDQICAIIDEQVSNSRVIFGAYNNALFLVMGNAIDKVRTLPGYGQRMKQKVNAVWKAFKMYEGEMRYGEAGLMTVKGLSETARKYYNEDITDAQFYEFWCATGAFPYKILDKWATVLANKYRVFLLSRNVKDAETAGWLMAVQDLFGIQEHMWQKIVYDFAVPNGLWKVGIERGLGCFRMHGVGRNWWKMLVEVCPEIEHIEPDEAEQKNFEVSRHQIMEQIDTVEFYYGGAMDATTDYQEFFRTSGQQKKSLRQMAECRAQWEERIK